MKENKKPSVRALGGDKSAGGAILSIKIVPQSAQQCNLAALNAAAGVAKQRGDYQRFWTLRRGYLLLQAAAYMRVRG